MRQQLTSTLEDYLEAIFRIQREKRFARVRDISGALNVAKSAVTAALRSLSEKGLVNYEPYEPVTLSSEGRERAERIALRHRIMGDFLNNVLGLEPQQADSIACGVEHAIDRDALERFVCFLAFVGRQREEGQSWLDEFQRFIREGVDDRTCQECIQEYLQSVGTDTEPEKA